MLAALFVAATIAIAPTDDYKKIEAAQPGDEVVIAPGTYKFLVYLTHSNVFIHAQDPKNPPVWDLNGMPLETAPGSYTAGDRNRGCWQLSGATGVKIESIVFQNCRDGTDNASGIRYYNASEVTIRDCLFKTNDNGLTGGTQDSTALVEFSEFDSNGNANASSPTPSPRQAAAWGRAPVVPEARRGTTSTSTAARTRCGTRTCTIRCKRRTSTCARRRRCSSRTGSRTARAMKAT